MSRRIRAAALAAVAMLLACLLAPLIAIVSTPALAQWVTSNPAPGSGLPLPHAAGSLLLCATGPTTAVACGTQQVPLVVSGSTGSGGSPNSSGGYAPVSAAPSFKTATMVSGQVLQLFPAEATGVARVMFSITVAAQGDSDLNCTDDGSAPSATNADFVVYAHGNSYRSFPEFVSNQALTCFAVSGTAHVTAESYP